MVHNERTRGKTWVLAEIQEIGFKLKKETNKKTVRVTECWYRLPREVVQFLPLEIYSTPNWTGS